MAEYEPLLKDDDEHSSEGEVSAERQERRVPGPGTPVPGGLLPASPLQDMRADAAGDRRQRSDRRRRDGEEGAARSRSPHRRQQPGGADGEQLMMRMFREMGRQLKRATSKRRSGEDSSSEEEERRSYSIARLLATYHLGDTDVRDLPNEKVCHQVIDRVLRQARKHPSRPPIVDLELTAKLVPSRDCHAPWVNTASAKSGSFVSNLTVAQFSVVWWGRARLQLLAQAATEVELMSMGQLFGRWTIIQRLAYDVGLKVAKEYEEATWRSTVQNIRAGVGACGDRLARLDRDILAECKRRVESEVEAHHGEPSKAALAGGEQRASAPWAPRDGASCRH